MQEYSVLKCIPMPPVPAGFVGGAGVFAGIVNVCVIFCVPW